jgi:hypothetical protein
MIHSKYFKPRVFPWASARVPEQIDRAQDIGGDLTLNREKQYEIGREERIGFKHNTPTFTYTMRQFEYGDMALWYSLANKVTPGSGESRYIMLDDIKATKVDIAAFLTDDNNTFTGTIWFPKLRVNTCSINVGDPQAIVERNFNLVGEDYKILDGKYFAYATETVVASGTSDLALILDGSSGAPPVPVEYASGKYIFKVLRDRAGIVSELVEDETLTDDDTWSYNNGTKTVTAKTCFTNDIVKVYYESSTAYDTLWTDNDVDQDFLLAESCEIYMKVGVGDAARIYRLQSIGIDVAFERTDYREIGNTEIVQTGVKNKTVTINLEKYSEGNTLEELLAGNPAYPFIDPRTFAEDIQLMIKVFSDSTHTSFKMGYLIQKISPIAMSTTQAVQDYNKRTNRLESDELKISDLESEIVFA